MDNLLTVCNTSDLNFIKETYLVDSIRKDFCVNKQQLLVALLVKLNALGGFKGEIDDFTKQDLSNLILNRFNGLSVIEIYKAFENERYGVYGDKTNGYNYFNADYVSEILIKYQNWKQKIKSDHNITLESVIPKPALPELTDNAKKEIIKTGIIRIFNEFKENKSFGSNSVEYVFDELVSYGLIKLSMQKGSKLDKYYESKMNIAKSIVISNARKIENTHDKNKIINEVKSNTSNQVILKMKELVLEEYFLKLITDDADIETIIEFK